MSDKLKEAIVEKIKEHISYNRHLKLVGKEQADRNLFFAIEGFELALTEKEEGIERLETDVAEYQIKLFKAKELVRKLQSQLAKYSDNIIHSPPPEEGKNWCSPTVCGCIEPCGAIKATVIWPSPPPEQDIKRRLLNIFLHLEEL